MKKKVIKETKSLCPICLKQIKAKIIEKNGKIWLEKECKKHGKFEEIYYEDAKMYYKFRKFATRDRSIKTAFVKSKGNCPYDCGLCNQHKSFTALANIVVTNRCDLRCFYCFYYAREGKKIYEPSLEQIREMLLTLKKERPIEPTAVQLTGGEPLLREDILDIIKLCKEMGFQHVQLNTNGIRLAFNKNLVKKVKEYGCNTLYLSFDGVSKETNPKNHWEVPFLLKNCREAGLKSIVLVPTLIRGMNSQEIGEIINFALNNLDVVRGVNFQPISFVGRASKRERERQRITIPGAIEEIERQTNGAIGKEDFYPVPFVTPLSDFASLLSGKEKYKFTTHFACGAATYVFLDRKRGKVIPITRFVDVEGLMEYIKEKNAEMKKGKSKRLTALKVLLNINKFIDKEKKPKDLNLSAIFKSILIKRNYKALSKFHYQSLFIGMMHFMDAYNYDIERVQRCCIHYLTPSPKAPIVPFCSFNCLTFKKEKIEDEYGLTEEEYKKLHPKWKGFDQDVYKRDVKKLERSRIYRECYGKLKNFFE